jgi:glycosyltransferase involved in cell wall biosynthesis
MPDISVIIPAYNAEKYLAEAIESALNQTRPAKEIIVVDDASTDRTVEIARSFGDRVTVLQNAVNSGPGYSRNAGVAASTGEYLAFLDADDKWWPEHLSVLADILDSFPNVALASSRAELTGLRSGIWPEPMPIPSEQPANCFLLFMRFNFTGPSAWLVRRAICNDIGGFKDIEERFRGKRIQAEDYDFLLRISYGNLIYASTNATYYYHWHPDQSSINNTQQLIMMFKYRIRLLEDIGDSAAQYHIGVERMIRHWECYLESAWAQRNIIALRGFISYGCKQALLSEATAPYRTRAWLPHWFIAISDLLKCCRRRLQSL